MPFILASLLAINSINHDDYMHKWDGLWYQIHEKWVDDES